MQVLVQQHTRAIARQISFTVVVFVLLVVMERVGWSVILKTAALRVFQPFELFGITTLSAIEFPVRWVLHERVSAQEMQLLQKSYAEALAQLGELETVKKENETLRALVEKESKPLKKRLLAAPIISYSLTAVAKGSDDGVQEGNLVYINETLVGRITRVEANQSEVTLFTHPESMHVLVQTETGVQGLLIGTGKQLEVTQLPTQAHIGVGERITTVGQPGVPPNQFIGTVAAVSQGQTAPTQNAVISELTSFFTASLVEIR